MGKRTRQSIPWNTWNMHTIRVYKVDMNVFREEEKKTHAILYPKLTLAKSMPISQDLGIEDLPSGEDDIYCIKSVDGFDREFEYGNCWYWKGTQYRYFREILKIKGEL